MDLVAEDEVDSVEDVVVVDVEVISFELRTLLMNYTHVILFFTLVGQSI